MMTSTLQPLFDAWSEGTRGRPFFILGPCVVETESILREIATELVRLREKLGLVIIFKASYDKANRTSASSFRGIGHERGLELLVTVGREFGFPTVTDVHESASVPMAARYVDMLQIPAFLCRQTDLLVAAGESGLPVNIKKGQFMAPAAIQHSVAKVKATGNERVFVTERGTSFGHGDLIVDYRGFDEMRRHAPLIFDATHSAQLPPTGGTTTSGNRENVKCLARAAAAVGVDGFFLETHPDPDHAPSDGPNMVKLAELPPLLERLLALCAVAA